MISLEIPGVSELARIGELGNKVEKTVWAEARKIAIDIAASVKRDKLSGQVLKRRTGTLSRSISQRVEVSTSGRIEMLIGTNVEYARRHEFGFSGSETVKAHMRKTKTGAHSVRSHARKVNTPARSFIRSAIQDMRVQIKDRLEAATREGLGI